MHATDGNRMHDRELAALFAAAEAPPEADELFVAGVMKQIRARERTRWLVLGGSALIASVFAIPALWDFLAAWQGIDMSLLQELGGRLDQAGTALIGFLQKAVRSVTFLTAAVLAVMIGPLLRWLAD